MADYATGEEESGGNPLAQSGFQVACGDDQRDSSNKTAREEEGEHLFSLGEGVVFATECINNMQTSPSKTCE